MLNTKGMKEVKLFKRIRDSWNAYIQRLGESNASQYGSKPMSCCSVNKKLNDSSKG